MLKILEDLFGITARDIKIKNLEAYISELKNSSCANAIAHTDLNQRYNDLFKKNQGGQDELASCKTSETLDQKRIKELEIKLAEKLGDVFDQALPSLLVQEPNEKKVVLGDFVIKTAQGDQTFTYPQPSATFMPCPIYEPVLNAADCNRPRPDLTELEICKKIANVCQLGCSYVTDQNLWGRMDNHTPAVIVARLRRDDCESLTDNILSAITYYQFKFGAFKTIAATRASGHLVYAGERYGHTFGLLASLSSSDFKDNFVIESTDRYAADLLPLDKYGTNYEADWGVIGFPRRTFTQGTYQVKTPWWVQLEAVVSINPSIMERITGILKPGQTTSKEEALKRFAEERKKEV